jgi:hypothetical protein
MLDTWSNAKFVVWFDRCRKIFDSMHSVSVCRWYAKRFLHPDVVEPYEYIFIWDEDLGLEHFDPTKYVQAQPL